MLSGLADTDWSSKAQTAYEKIRAGIERPRYDRTEAALADALEDHRVVLIPRNNSVQLRRARNGRSLASERVLRSVIAGKFRP